jgi:hypothetical protein
MHDLLIYEVGEDYVSKRAQFRELHLKKAWEASERGELILAAPSRNRWTTLCCYSEATRPRLPRSLPGLIPTL